jgi:hypothetical protein
MTTGRQAMSICKEKQLTHEQLQGLIGFRPLMTISKILLFFALLAAVTALAWRTDSELPTGPPTRRPVICG